MSGHGAVRTLAAMGCAWLFIGGASGASAAQTHPYRSALVDTDAASGVVATAIHFPAGSAADPRGGEGTATLVGRLLEVQLTRALRSVGASVQVQVTPESTVVSLISTRDGWAEAAERTISGIRDEPFDLELADRERAELVQVLMFESGAPVREFEIHRAGFLYGELDDRARPTMGTPATVGAIATADLEAFRARHFAASDAVFAVTGPVESTTVARVIGSGFDELRGGVATRPAVGGGAAPRLELHREGDPLGVPSSDTPRWAWDSPRREILDRDVTSTWITVATPLPAGTPRVLAEFLAHLIGEDLNPSPPDPALYSADVELRNIQDTPVLVATASVDPQSTTTWEDRLSSAMAGMAAAPPEGAFFELSRRRFRSEVVLTLAVPEERARWLVHQLALDGEVVSSPEQGIWRVSRDAIADLARAAGPPRVLLFGPERMMSQE